MLVAVLFYRLLILVKGTRSAQMYVGLLVIVLIGILAREFDLIAVKWIVDSLKTVWLIAFVILFQPELRHALGPVRAHALLPLVPARRQLRRAGRDRARRRDAGRAPARRADRHRAQRRAQRNFVETGTSIDAKVSAELLVTLFSPGSPLHDGAVIMREDTVVAAACILPLSANPRTADDASARATARRSGSRKRPTLR